MPSEKKKFQKKKAREKEVHKKILRRRERIRSEREAEQAKEDQLEAEYNATKVMPIINDPFKKEEMIKARLRKNMQILEALEAEYLQVQQSKGELNKLLEEEGAITLAEKLDALGKRQGLNKIEENSASELNSIVSTSDE